MSTVIFSVYFEAISSVSSVVSVQKSPAVYSDPVRLISFCPCCSCKILFYFFVFNLLKRCTFFTKNYTACGSQCFLSLFLIFIHFGKISTIFSQVLHLLYFAFLVGF